MHTLVAYGASIANGTVYGQVAGVPDGAMTQDSNKNYIVPTNMQVLAAWMQQANLTACQIQAPSLRNIAYPEVYPVSPTAVATVPNNYGLAYYGQNGPRLVQNESVGMYVSVGGAAAAVAHGGLWLANQFTPAPQGMITTLLATSNNTLIAEAWTLSTLAFNTQLAAGEYAVVGMRVTGPSATFCRLLFPGGTNYRPGVICDNAYGNFPRENYFRWGRLGLFGTFVFNAPPQIEVFGAAAGAQTIAVFLDVIKTR